MDIEKLARTGILKMLQYEAPYVVDTITKLNQNESPYDVPDMIKDKIIARLSKTSFNRYNDGNSTRLRELLAIKLGLGKENIVVGAGIDELLYYLTLAFVERGDKVLRFSPSFDLYRICGTISNAKDCVIQLNEDFSLPEEFEIESKDAKLVFICSPNNPTGNIVPTETIKCIAKTTSGLVCIDEAYVDFADEDCLPLLSYDNVVIMRTFSKAFSAAAIRIGYALANEKIIGYINRVKLPWNVSIFSQIAAEEIIQTPKSFEERVEGIKSERSRLFKELQKLCVTAYPSQANFILFKIDNANSIFKCLIKQGILVRSFSSPELKNCLRVTIGTREQNDRFLQALGRCLQ